MYERYDLWEGDNIPLYRADAAQIPYVETALLQTGCNNPCVIVIPGGAYEFVSVGNEGYPICEFLNDNGYSAVMLTYRVKPYGYPCQLTDLKRAIRLTRFHARDWNIDPEKIGVIGFSAGGHLAMTGALAFDEETPNVGDEIDRLSARPNTVCLSYAVCSLDEEITHARTRKVFLGENDASLSEKYSGENMVRPDAPPFFIWHTAEDKSVKPECSLRMASALIKNGVACECHILPFGGHGISLAKGMPLTEQWSKLYLRWLNFHMK